LVSTSLLAIHSACQIQTNNSQKQAHSKLAQANTKSISQSINQAINQAINQSINVINY